MTVYTEENSEHKKGGGQPMDDQQRGEILVYKSENSDAKIDVYLEEGTVWLSQALITKLYQTTPQIIILHARNIYKEGELTVVATCK